ncbi:MAG TPA: hypothetical protein VJ617_19470 [Arthrobacter sp.]|nr:hypothetical protein [Arthrobacter sp.]
MHLLLGSGMELGIFTFGDIHRDPVHGSTVSPEQNTQDLLERARLADGSGVTYNMENASGGALFVGNPE